MICMLRSKHSIWILSIQPRNHKSKTLRRYTWYLGNGGKTSAANVGHRVILPPSLLGGSRDMKKDIWIPCLWFSDLGNLKCLSPWHAIQIGQKSNMNWQLGKMPKTDQIWLPGFFVPHCSHWAKQIMEKHVFGDVAAIIYVVEFQKRSLPHAHILIILKPNFKIKCPEDFDR